MITFYISCILLLIIGGALAYYGAEHFGLSLALSYGVPNFLILLVLNQNPDISSFILGNIEPLSMYPLLSLLIGSIVIYFFSKFLMYAYAWLILVFVIANPLMSIGLGSGTGLLIGLIAATGLVWYFRTHLKRTVIGLISGLTIAMGLVLLVFKNAMFNGDFDGLLDYTGFIMIVCLAGGVAFQYLYILKKKPIEIEA
jgi:hypothetical protein